MDTQKVYCFERRGGACNPNIEPAANAATPGRLGAVMDAIIPRQGNMPSATEAGGLRYFAALKQAEPGLAAEIQAALDQVGDSSPAVEALQRLEREHPAQFVVLRDFVYEAYYTQPQVWKLIGYEFHATDHQGPKMKPFDEAVLATVRTKPKHYRETRRCSRQPRTFS